MANELGLPIILVNVNYGGLNDFLSSIQQDVTILIDEYEKVFVSNNSYRDDDEETPVNGSSTLLSLMDGTYKTEFRKVFILTTNRIWLNENMLNRPGRIRYVKQFRDLNLSQINEIIDDCLVDKSFKESIIDFIKPLKIITVDIVKAIVSEVNIFNDVPTEVCQLLNIEFKDDEYEIYKVEDGKEEVMQEHIDLNAIKHVITAGGRWKSKNLIINDEYYYVVAKPDYVKGLYTVNTSGTSIKDENITVVIRKQSKTHKSFLI